jgi:hypothetical protein
VVWWVSVGVVGLSLVALLAVLASLRGRLAELARVALAVERAVRARRPPPAAAAVQETLAGIRTRLDLTGRRPAGRRSVASGRSGPSRAGWT